MRTCFWIVFGLLVSSAPAHANSSFQVSPVGAPVAVGLRDDGSMVAAWYIVSPVDEIRARLFSFDGIAIGEEFTANDTAATRHSTLGLGIASDGSFVVAHRGQNGRIQVRLFSADAQPLGPSVDYALVGSGGPDVVMRANDGFVLVWNGNAWSPGAYVRAFKADGTPHASLFQVADARVGSIAVNQSDTLLALREVDEEGPLLAEAFDLSGSSLGPSSEIATPPTGEFFSVDGPRVAAGSDGNFLAVWALLDQTVHARRVSPSGVPLGLDFEVSTTTPLDVGFPFAFFHEVGSHPDGGYTVSWTVSLPFNPTIGGTESEFWARRVSIDGVPLGDPFIVRPRRPDWLEGAAMDAGPAWAFAGLWSGPVDAPIEGRTFSAPAAPMIGLASALTLGVILLFVARRNARSRGRANAGLPWWS